MRYYRMINISVKIPSLDMHGAFYSSLNLRDSLRYSYRLQYWKRWWVKYYINHQENNLTEEKTDAINNPENQYLKHEGGTIGVDAE